MYKDKLIEAVRQNGGAIKHIVNPDKDIQLAAVQQNEYAIRCIDNPAKEVINRVKEIR